MENNHPQQGLKSIMRRERIHILHTGWQHLCSVIFSGMICASSIFASDGVPANFQSVNDPENHLDQSFIFRSGGDQSPAYYKVEMNEVIYAGLNAFFWPDSLTNDQKVLLPAYSTPAAIENKSPESEIMFNDRLILSYSPQLYLLNGKNPVRLQSAKDLRVFRLVSDLPYQVHTYNPSAQPGLQMAGTTPMFLYATAKDKGITILISAKNKIPHEKAIQIEKQKFTHLQADLTDIPLLESSGLDILLDVDENSSETQKLQVVDSILKTSRTALQKDSANVFLQLDSLTKVYSRGAPRQNWESERQYQHRRSLFLQQQQDFAQVILMHSNIKTRHQEFREKIMLMEAFRESLVKSIAEAEAIRRLDARKELMKVKLWGLFYLNAFGVLGRNVPEYAADPGPADSWGIGGNLLYSHNLWKFITISYKVEGSMYRWKYFASIPTISAQERGSLGVNFSVPLLAAVHSYGEDITGFVVALRIGGHGGYGRTAVDKGERTPEEKFDFFGGGSAAIDIYPPSVPLVVSLEYTYDSMHFGDLRFGFGMPLSFLPVLGQGDSP